MTPQTTEIDALEDALRLTSHILVEKTAMYADQYTTIIDAARSHLATLKSQPKDASEAVPMGDREALEPICQKAEYVTTKLGEFVYAENGRAKAEDNVRFTCDELLELVKAARLYALSRTGSEGDSIEPAKSEGGGEAFVPHEGLKEILDARSKNGQSALFEAAAKEGPNHPYSDRDACVVRVIKEDRGWKGTCGRIGEEYAVVPNREPFVDGWHVIGTVMGLAKEDCEVIPFFTKNPAIAQREAALTPAKREGELLECIADLAELSGEWGDSHRMDLHEKHAALITEAKNRRA